AGDHGRDQRAGRDGTHHESLGGVVDGELLLDVEDCPRDDAGVVAEEPSADGGDGGHHGDEERHLPLARRTASRRRHLTPPSPAGGRAETAGYLPDWLPGFHVHGGAPDGP